MPQYCNGSVWYAFFKSVNKTAASNAPSIWMASITKGTLVLSFTSLLLLYLKLVTILDIAPNFLNINIIGFLYELISLYSLPNQQPFIHLFIHLWLVWILNWVWSNEKWSLYHLIEVLLLSPNLEVILLPIFLPNSTTLFRNSESFVNVTILWLC